MKTSSTFLLASALALGVSCQSNKPASGASTAPEAVATPVPTLDSLPMYPQTKKITHTDTYHGTQVPDPYRWLEADTAQDVAEWVKAQNQVTFDYLEKIPFRNQIKERLTKLWNYPKYGAPFREGDYYYFYKNDGLQNQAVLYRMKGLDGTPELFLDPNKLSTDGTTSLGSLAFSKDARYAVYTTSTGGSDWRDGYVLDVATGKKLMDELHWIKFSGTSWHQDGFFYSRYAEPKQGSKMANKNEYHQVYYHKVGTPQSQDKLIWEAKQHPLRLLFAGTTEDEKYLILTASEGTSNNSLYVKDLSKASNPIVPLVESFGKEYGVVENIGDKLIVLTNQDAPKYKLIEIDLSRPQKANWKTLVPETDNVLNSAALVGGKLVLNYMKDAATLVRVHDTAGKWLHDVKLPTLGTASGFSGKKADKTVFYTFTSFTYPSAIYQYDVASNASTLYKKAEIDVNMDAYETRQVFYPSKDGTKIPMFITHKKGLKLDGNNPTYLYAYGGFNASMTPYFSVSNMLWLENGGVLAIANIRGGGEYGEDWHKAGMTPNKQNVFDDFIAAAEHLIAQKYTSSQKLAIAGGSNGGLLIGAVVNQRPELFKVALPAVGVMDMLRFHKFTIGWAWVPEYGSSDDAKQFQNLMAFSPIHNLKDGVNYPATLVTTADHDDRVVPAHSFKYIATLQEEGAGFNPYLIRVDVKAGHGAGKSTTAQIAEAADVWSFVYENMGVNPYQK
ncbi:prolyl endopeptidase [Rufibacter sp. DG15C]|uniref:prolyl oligopeptidase family serine peptidase n=1 Tax=Rufibacter sp. DG15C TaxID=1379909 RepID=UPI00078B539A|nr:prolyl oligopeptidase family serine peptidase [Rufibacter sp. DG15C]AMM50837.1 prolyl endopeptidase [Rufibacter sp. DG15C]